MSMAQLREHYNVPAKRGGKIEFTDKNNRQRQGVITSASTSLRLRVRLEGLNHPVALHPTWNINYISSQ